MRLRRLSSSTLCESFARPQCCRWTKFRSQPATSPVDTTGMIRNLPETVLWLAALAGDLADVLADVERLLRSYYLPRASA